MLKNEMIRRLKRALTFACFVLGVSLAWADVSITNLKVEPIMPWGKVAISYEVSGDFPVWADKTELIVSHSNYVTHAVTIARPECVSGDTVIKLGTHYVVWDLDKNGIDASNLCASFSVRYAIETPLYLVVDLSGGASAASYSVTGLSSVPTGGWSDEYKTSKIVLRRIGAGTFIMGADQTDESHRVTLTKPFYLGVFEVTQRQWELVMGDGKIPSYFNNAQYYSSRPVEQVGWTTILLSFLVKLSARAGMDFSMPSEAQWEYACRAGTTSDYNSGENCLVASIDSNMNKVGRYGGNSGYYPNAVIPSSSCSTGSGTAKVGSYSPNSWGLYDMHGNVDELCEDVYAALAYGVDPEGPSRGANHVVRGGNWSYGAISCISSVRGGIDRSTANKLVGFRLCWKTLICAENAAIGDVTPISKPSWSDAIIFATALPTNGGAIAEFSWPLSVQYSPHGRKEVRVSVNGEELVSSSESGDCFWQRPAGGRYVLVHQTESDVFEVAYDLPCAQCAGVTTKPAVEPTSSTSGMTAEIICSRCGELIQAATEIPALGYVRNVTARQLWPHKKVEVCYTLAEDIGEVADASTELILTGKYGSTTKTASRKVGATPCVPGSHCIVWDFEGDSIAVNQSSMKFTVKYGSVSGTTSGVAINTSSTVKNGMSVDKTMALAYSPIDAGACEVEIDGTVALSSTNGGTFVWQPLTKGTHTIKHIAGDNVWTRTVNVTELVHELPEVAPPTEADPNITIGTTSRSLATAARASGSITTSGTGTWTATVSSDWITIPATLSSRKAGLPVAYTVAANTDVEERTGYIYVSGHVYTISQAGVGAELDSYSVDVETDGGRQTVTVLADSQIVWHAWSNVDWLSVETAEGVGEATVVFTIAPWNEVSTRSGTLTVAGCTFTVNQTGRHMKLNRSELTTDYHAHDIVVTIDALASTSWGVAVDVPWLSIVEGGSGSGGSAVALAINENPSYLARTATAIVGSESFAVHQQGRTTEALEFAISPERTTASVKGANGLISVEATPDLPWTSVSQASWLTVMPSFLGGTGNGNIVYAASPNPTMKDRIGTISISPEQETGLETKVHTVSQPAATAMISDSAYVFPASGGSFDVAVMTDEIVQWTIAENVDWVSVVGEMNRVGSGSVMITVSGNTSIEPRESTMTIAGHSFAIRQKGQAVEVEYDSRTFDAIDFGEASIDVHPNGTASWTAVSSDPSWIIIYGGENCEVDADGNASGTGDATIYYMVAPYVGDGESLTGWITIGDKTVYITQRAYDYTIEPNGVSVSGNSGEGDVAGPAGVSDVWEAIATEPWITTVINYDSSTGNGTVHYTFTDNDTGEARTGKIIIAGEEYTITQAARQLVTITATVMGEGCVEVEKVGGGGQRSEYTFDRGTAVDLTAVASNGWRFVRWEKDGGTIGDGTQTLSVTADVDQEIVAVFERIPVYTVNGESVVEGTIKSFTAPATVVLGGTTQLVCRGTSAYPGKGTAFQLKITGDVSFEWDLWQTNYLLTVGETANGKVIENGVALSSRWVASGSTVTVKAVPNAGQSFYRWIGDPLPPVLRTANEATMSFTMNSAANVGALFGLWSDTLATATDAPSMTFTTGGDAMWTPVIDATAQSGVSSVRSGIVGAESESWMETTVNGPGMLSFNWRVDCEKDDSGKAEWDRLAVFTNGVEAARIDGKTGWQQVALPIPGGKTTVRWSFYRDDYDEAATGCAHSGWVDGISFQ